MKIFAFAAIAALACANPILYNVTVDTSSIDGTTGSLDFNFNPGPLVTQSASLQILGFTSDGTLAGNCPCTMGDVTGQLPATLTFDNGSFFNDYFDDFTFGNTLSFQASFFGPALSSPDGASTSGSTFAFSMFSDEGTTPVLTNDTINGFAFTVNINLDGTTTVANSSPQTTVVPAGTTSAPEPGTFALLATALIAAAFQRRLASRSNPTPTFPPNQPSRDHRERSAERFPPRP
jgi:hypothetical protein